MIIILIKKTGKIYDRVRRSFHEPQGIQPNQLWLFLVGSVLEGKYQGCVVNSLHQITSSNPAKFSLSLNKSNETYKAVEAVGSFAATVLERGTPKELVDLFGYKSGRVVNKYEGFQVETDGAGNPYVKDHALARISCKIVDKLDLGSYVLFVCEATEGRGAGRGSGHDSGRLPGRGRRNSGGGHGGPDRGGGGLAVHHLRLHRRAGDPARRLPVPHLPGPQG